MGERYFEVDIEEELEKEYVKECMLYINTKVVEAIQCLSRQTGGIEANRCPEKLMKMVKTMDNFDDINLNFHECPLEDSRESRGV